MLDGEASIAGKKLAKRDGLGIWNTAEIEVKAESNAKILLMDVPFSSRYK